MSPVTCPLSVRAVSRGLPLRPSLFSTGRAVNPPSSPNPRPLLGPPCPRLERTENNHRTMVDLEYQFTHPCGACSMCGGDVVKVRTHRDDDTDKDDDDSDAPSADSDDDSDHVQDGPDHDAPDDPNGQPVKRHDWMRSFCLCGSILAIPFHLLYVLALTSRVLLSPRSPPTPQLATFRSGFAS